jgi:ATP-dependent DNA helicase RecQ
VPPLSEPRARVAARLVEGIAGPGARLRDDQETAVAALCEPGARVLVVQATGWGKSAVYWAATAIRRAEGAGPTLVVSPLLSLMRDQVAAAGRAGLRAATVNSSNIGAWEPVERDLLAGALDVLLVSPERLANPGFGRRVLDAVVGRLGLLVIDEAHAISDWGHDFRPDYRRVADMVRRLRPDTPILATTATANARVTADVAAQLGESALVLRGALARPSLQLAVVGGLSPLERFAWVVRHLPALPGSGIVYTLTVADAERLAAVIAEHHGDAAPVAAYTGRLDDAERERLEGALLADEMKALVATSALGMGYDKPDLGFCVHVGSPPSPVAYYQQVGRAGRAIGHAPVVLLHAEADARIWDHFETATIPDPERMRRLLAAMPRDPADAASVPALEARTGIRRTRIDLMLKQLAVDGAVERRERGWVATGEPYVFPRAHYDAVIAVRRREAEIMRAYTRGERCLMQLLQEALDDPTARPCGRCSVCLGRLPEGLSERVPDDVVRSVAGALRRESHVVEPRRMWPGGSFGSRRRIPPELQAEPGRALAFADAPEWREVMAAAFARDAPAPAEVLSGCVDLLARWSREWTARPGVVVALPAAGRPLLARSVAGHVAAAGRLPAAEIAIASLPGPDLSSADEASHWRDALALPTDAGPPVAGRVVLLVVDATASLWPVTVAAWRLREAGAAAVLPLVVHRRP